MLKSHTTDLGVRTDSKEDSQDWKTVWDIKTIVTTVLLGLFLTPALAEDRQLSKKISITGGYQILTINKQWHIATVEEKTAHKSSKVILNYDTGFIATKVLPEKVCFVSLMNREEIPSLDDLPRLAEENNVRLKRSTTKELIYIVRRPVRDLKSYGPDIFSMCKGLMTYVASEVHEPQHIINLGSCIRVDVLQIFNLKYCRDNSKA
ncbi:gastrokine-1 [Tyto alba]|uniref:gastrokine-1 n=1 Tax=Tyto alba TaxID=56313 RepID=UPI001C66537F|nr:gastrokine-1 [Tyto alba]